MRYDAQGKSRVSTNALIAWSVGFLVLFVVALSMVASSGNADPTDVAPGEQSLVTATVNASVIVFREGLEAVLIFAAITASFLGARQQFRRPVVLGVAAAFGATVLTWFVMTTLLSQLPVSEDVLLAITGIAAVVILLLVMNWFFHKVYWTDHIKELNSKKRDLVAESEAGDGVKFWGFFALGFTAVYREGFEVVLFLQNLNISAGGKAVFWGVACGLAGTAVVGFITFYLHHKLPYKRMLVLTGVLLGLVLVVMVGGSARTLQALGVLPTHVLPVSFPDWWARWFEVVPTYETVGMQLVAAVFVVGSYYAAEWWSKEKRRRAKAAHSTTSPAQAVSTVLNPPAMPDGSRQPDRPQPQAPRLRGTDGRTESLDDTGIRAPHEVANTAAIFHASSKLPDLAWRRPNLVGSPAAQRGVARAEMRVQTPRTICGHEATTLCGCDARTAIAAADTPSHIPPAATQPVRPTLHAPALVPRPLLLDSPHAPPVARLADRPAIAFGRKPLAPNR